MKGRILVLDNSNPHKMELTTILNDQFDVVVVKNHFDAVELCEYWSPDILVMDIDEITSGLDACRFLRNLTETPILFSAADCSAETQMAVFEAGANDIFVKPVTPSPLIHKVELAISNQRKQIALQKEQQNLHSMAMNFLSSLGESGVLMNFVRASISAKSYEELAGNLAEALRELQITCFGEVRHSNGLIVAFSTSGVTNELEQAVVSQLANIGRLFQFKSQIVVNYPCVSIVIQNLPADADDQVGRIRDNIAVLAETTNALCENVQMRQNANAHAEQLQLALMQANSAAILMRDQMKQTLVDTRILLHEMENSIHQAHSWLGTTSDQEREISNMMEESIHKILDTISKNTLDNLLDGVIGSFSTNNQMNEAELF